MADRIRPMARPWEQIEADPAFQALEPDRKAAVQQQWVADAVSKLPSDRQNDFREYVFAQYPHGNEDPAYGQPLDEGMEAGLEQGFQKGLAATFFTGPGAVASALGFEDNDLLRAGRQIEAGIEADSPISRENQQRFPVKAAVGIGQAGSMVVTAPLAGAGTGFRAASLFGKARQIALMGGLQGAAAGEQRAVDLGVTDPLAKAGTIMGYGAVEFLSEKAFGFVSGGR